MKEGTAMSIILGQDAVNETLIKEGMEDGNCPIESFLIQRQGAGMNAAVMLIVVLPDGKKVLAKTTLRLMEMGVNAARLAVGPHIDAMESGDVH